MRKAVKEITYIDEVVKERFKRIAMKNMHDFTVAITREDEEYLKTPPDYLIECIDSDILTKHCKYVRDNSYTKLCVKRLDRDEYQVIITSAMTDFHGYLYNPPREHTDEGLIMDYDDALELITMLLSDGLCPAHISNY